MDFYSEFNLKETWSSMVSRKNDFGARKLPVGVDGVGQNSFEINLDRNLKEISRRIHRGLEQSSCSYKFAPLLELSKPKKEGGQRKIYIPRIRDQIVFRTIHDVLIQSALDSNLNLAINSPVKALEIFKNSIISEGYLLKLDIEDFYGSIKRSDAIGLACQLIKDPSTLSLLDHLQQNDSIIGRKAWTAGKLNDQPVSGLPAGVSLSASLSELWAQFRIDKAVQGVDIFHSYHRYVDDICFICRNEEEAHNARKQFQELMTQNGITFSDEKSCITAMSEGPTWLGMKHYPDYAEIHPGRANSWMHRFASIYKTACLEFRTRPEDRQKILENFHHSIKKELAGVNSFRLSWHSLSRDTGLWRQMDRSLHTMIRSLYRQMGLTVTKRSQLPSVQRSVIFKQNNQFSAPSKADQGQRAIHSHHENLTADQGLKAPDGADPNFKEPINEFKINYDQGAADNKLILAL